MSRRAERRRLARAERRLAAVEEQLDEARVMLFEALRMVRVDRAHLVFLRGLLTDSEAAERADRQAREHVDHNVRQILGEAEPPRPELRVIDGGRDGVGTADVIGRDRHGLRAV